MLQKASHLWITKDEKNNLQGKMPYKKWIGIFSILFALMLLHGRTSTQAAVKRIDLDGKNKKTLAKMSNIRYTFELTDRYVKYTDEADKNHVKRF